MYSYSIVEEEDTITSQEQKQAGAAKDCDTDNAGQGRAGGRWDVNMQGRQALWAATDQAIQDPNPTWQESWR